MLRRSFAVVSIGCWVGLLAGIATAVADFGAHWLFLDAARDRTWLGVHLLALQAAVGTAIGLGSAALVVLAQSAAQRASRTHAQTWQAGLLALLMCPALCVLARLLWSGGMMSRLPLRPLGIGLTALALTLGAGLACFGATRIVRAAGEISARRARVLIGLLLTAAFAIGKLNQWLLPTLYDYLHASLALITFGLYALAASIVWLRLREVRWRHVAVPCALAALVGGLASTQHLEQNQNVRVALVSPNMPSSRALMQAAAPFLPKVSPASVALAKQHAQAARQRRAARSADAQLPQLDDAHLLLITVDALRADHLGLHGYTRPISKEIDALGARGIVFEHAYAQAPHSSYSLCSLMTSDYLHETTELGITPPERTLPRMLAEDGFHTAGFYTQGIFHTAAERLGGYERDAFGFALTDHQDRPAEEMTDRVLTEVDRTLERGEPNAFFWVHYFDVHEPYEATTLGTRDIDRYDSELLATDAAIGRLVREITRRMKKPVIVALTADHGEEFHEHGGVYHGSSLYEEQTHVPLVLVVPGVAPRRVTQPVESIDITPSLLGLLGVPRAPSMRGSDLRGLFASDAFERGPVFSAVIHKKMVVSWPYKLIADLRFGSFELYQLAADPSERDNRADREPERVRSLRGEVYAWLDSLTPATHTPRRAGCAARCMRGWIH